ncbi:MAG: hypothetical protein RLZZ157_1048, partial [Pseudomonadota bacterium]
SGPSAADVVASLSEAELAHLFFVYGEEREARRVARAMVNDRQVTPYTRTSQLAGLCARVIGRKHDGQIHPATRVFQALRIYVNDELGELEMALAASERALGEGGRLVVVTFHSLEDRVVKTFFNGRSKDLGGSRHAPVGQAAMPTFELMNRKPILAGPDEIAANPRARSAKLRAAIRTKAPARIGHVTGLAGVTPLDRLMRAA